MEVGETVVGGGGGEGRKWAGMWAFRVGRRWWRAVRSR